MATLDADDLDAIRDLLRGATEGVRLADTVSHGGADATLLMKSAEITNPAGTALTIHSDTVEAVSIEAVAVNASALVLSSSGAGGRGLAAIASGDGGIGAFLTGGVTDGIGLVVTGDAMDVQLSGSGTIEGPTAGASIAHVTLADGVPHGGTLGSSTATFALSNVTVQSQTADVDTVLFQGNGAGPAFHVKSGPGIFTSALLIDCDTASGFASGLTLVGAGNGPCIQVGDGGNGKQAVVLSAANGATALLAVGTGSNPAVYAQGGNTNGAGAVILPGSGTGPAVQLGNGTDGADALRLLAGVGATDAPGLSITGAGAAQDVALLGSGDIAPPAEAAGPPAGVLAAIMWLAARLGVRRVEKTASEVIVYLADGTTPGTTQPYTSSDTSAEETGPAT